MALQPKTAINFRSEEEREILKRVAEKQGIYTNDLSDYCEGRAYICPEGYHGADNIRMEIWTDPDERCSADDDDPFEWTYLEAADVLRNLIISERRKHAT